MTEWRDTMQPFMIYCYNSVQIFKKWELSEMWFFLYEYSDV